VGWGGGRGGYRGVGGGEVKGGEEDQRVGGGGRERVD